jgi:hypothetical protein
MKQIRLSVMIGVPVLAGLFSVAMGRDANWDFLNYRWYTPFSLLHGKLLKDVLISGHATFFNPLLELPFYLLATHVPAIVAGFAVAALDGACFIPLFLMAERTLLVTDPRYRTGAAFLIALTGLLGGGALGQIGVISWDMPLGILEFSSILVLLSDQQRSLSARPISVVRPLLLAGCLAGAAAGLKLTAAVYPLGIVTALLFVSKGSLPMRALRCGLFSAGTIAGLLVCGGYWMVRLYLAFGNPLMPFFNGVFQSPWSVPGSNRDTTFVPQSWDDILAFPFLFTANSRRVAEYYFRDSHMALAYGLIPLAAICLLLRREGSALIAAPAFKFLSVAFLVSYGAWLYLFAIYRYALPLEMLAPLIVVGAIGCLPLPRKATMALAAIVLLVSQATIHAGFNRREWTPEYVSATLPFSIPADALVLMPGSAPEGFIVTSLPPTVEAMRIGSALAVDNLYTGLMASRIADHKGDIYVLYYTQNRQASEEALATYNLAIDGPSCGDIQSNVADPMQICRTVPK